MTRPAASPRSLDNSRPFYRSYAKRKTLNELSNTEKTAHKSTVIEIL